MPYATRPGDVLADRYRLVDLLSESGDGRFWRAHDRVLERHVAIHVIRSDDARAPGLMEAARRAATVLDRRILRVLDADVNDQVCYVVNEWGWGASLDIVAAGTGPLGPRRSAWLVAEVADSIATAHRAGIAHGRLNPENVLIDRTGGVRIIGLCVDAALHGVPTDDLRHDLTDLAGLLHCALTATWGGASGSIVKPAPREHGEVLRPRRVRAGVPRPLDSLCEQLLHPDGIGRHRELDTYAESARGISDYLADFVGDPTGMAVALLSCAPAVLPDEELIVLPQVPELTPHDGSWPTTVTAASGSSSNGVAATGAEDVVPTAKPDSDSGSGSGSAAGVDRPTQAGLPIFGDDEDDVAWLERRTPPPPPPPFEDPPERPLFAPEPRDGAPARTARPGTRAAEAPAAGARGRDEYWPWDTGHGTGTGLGHGIGHGGTSSTLLPVIADDSVPGRSTFRLAGLVLTVLVVIVAVAVAVNLGRGRGVLGMTDDAGSTPSESATSPLSAAAPLAGVTATTLDPLGDGAENDDEAALAVDGDATTAWRTQGYNDQLGPPPGALKTGVGLVLDLGGPHTVSAVDLRLDGSPTEVSLYVTDQAPAGVDDLQPVATGTITGRRTATGTLEPTGEVTGSFVTVWLTSLPADGSVFRGRIAEVVVHGD